MMKDKKDAQGEAVADNLLAKLRDGEAFKRRSITVDTKETVQLSECEIFSFSCPQREGDRWPFC